MKKVLFLLLVTTSFNASSQATDAGSTMKLSAILAQLKEEYKGIMDQLEEAKAASETMTEINKISGEIYEEYKFINDFSIDNEIRMITNDIKGLSGLGGWSETDDEGKFRLLRAEIDRRFEDNPEKKKDLLNQVSEMERLEALKQKKLEEAAQAGNGSMNDKNLNSSIASSNALLSAIALSEEQQKIQDQMKKEGSAQDAKAYEDSFIEFLDKSKTNK